MVTFDIIDGSPGTLTFLMDAYDKYIGIAEMAFQRMQNAGITGTKLYMLWNDCCDRDTAKAVKVMIEKDIDDISEHINYEGGRGHRWEEESSVVTMQNGKTYEVREDVRTVLSMMKKLDKD